MATGRYPAAELNPSQYKSEAFVPIRQDSQSFEERQRMIWDDMHERMERRRKEWDDEVGRLRQDFFRLRPDDDAAVAARRSSSDNLLEKMDLNNMFYDNAREGGKVFRLSFDVSQFRPDEINVTTNDQRLIVHAKHEEKGGDKSVSREFSRQVDIPPNIDPQSLRSTLSKDGILQVEAPVSAPAYERIREASAGGGISPRLFSPAPGTPALSSSAAASGTISDRDGLQIFRISVDVGAEFDPADLTVKTVDKKLVVHARHEEKAPGRTSCREFNREFDLPDAVDPQSVTASMAPDGRLIIEAPILHGSGIGGTGGANVAISRRA